MDTRTSYLGLRLEHLPAPRHSAITWTPSSVSKTRGARRLSSIPFEEQITRACDGRVAHIDVRGSEFADVLEESLSS